MHEYFHALNLVPGISYQALFKLWHVFGSWKYAFSRGSFDKYTLAGLTESLSAKIIQTRKVLNINREYEYLKKSGITLILREDLEFPEILKNIPWPPFGLYRKGAALTSTQKPDNAHMPIKQDGVLRQKLSSSWCDSAFTVAGNVRAPAQMPFPSTILVHPIAIVGTRIPSAYGAKMAYEIGEKIALSGGTIVSGLAFGIDAAAHRGAVKNHKPTIAILASGLDTITPSNHLALAQSILETGGTLLSEYASGSVSYKGNFLARNRLISGLSQATIVIEAKEKSGALITAHHALEQGRDTYALVGDITRPQTRGCLNLLMQGSAHPIFSVEELMAQLGFNMKQTQLQQLDQNEIALLSLLKKGPQTIEELAMEADLEIWTLAGTLTQLEVKGLIRKNFDGKWEILDK